MPKNAWDNLNQTVKDELGDENDLVAVLVWDERRQSINCYGYHIPDGRIFHKTNMSTKKSIRYLTRKQFHGCQKGYLICAQECTRKAKPNWIVALVNVSINPDDFGAVPFSSPIGRPR